ncbi:lipocalin family protein [Flavobacterium sp. 2]|uniref:lipocalin family protein n=1 Tax=Flavobacterium sp. 2 TaxID=308053 RepID=UPI000C19DE3F|nr:lipocalin family protein [Flavobacterium sp. 2]PIF53700.1 lipocalin-like protein [Flavobacterium sp. 2]
MKKASILFLSALLIALYLSSCNSDNSSDNKENDTALLTGKWVPQKTGTIAENGNESLQEIPNPGKCDSGLLEYSSNGTFSNLRYEFQDNKCVSYNQKGTWSVKDKIITAIYDDGSTTLEILELNQSTLKLKQTLKTGTTLLVFISVYNRK